MRVHADLRDALGVLTCFKGAFSRVTMILSSKDRFCKDQKCEPRCRRE